MRPFSEMLNDLLVDVFNNILRYEEKYLQKSLGRGLTIREMHMIEYIGKAGAEGRTLSEIADFLKVARPSVTVSVKKLCGSGFLVKSGSELDGRVVHVTPTREGRKVFLQHIRFHMLMVRELEKVFDEDEKEILVKAIGKLGAFFDTGIESLGKK